MEERIKNSKLTFEEQRQVQLDILREVDAFCREKTIKYSLAFGTLLGAIRHHGYIPWDDDLDIMMPYDEMLRLRDELLSDNICFHDVDTDRTYSNPFGNLCTNYTYRRIGRYCDRGLGIDVYPIVKIPRNSNDAGTFFSIARRLQNKRQKAIRLRMFMLKHFSFSLQPGYSRCMKNYRDHLISQKGIDEANYYIIAGPLDRCNEFIYERDLFDSLTNVEFEGLSFKAISEYDFYLSKTYGDYMQFPPENQRHPAHGQKYYWK